nr:hypothetical protein [uncultured Flavobacterium sp.]
MKNLLILFLSTFLLFLKCNKPAEPKNQNHSELTKPIRYENNTLETSQTGPIKIKKVSPIKIIKATLHKSQYSNHKDIRVTFKNSGTKSIKAIKFEWFCINSFEEPANGRYFYGEGRFTENSVYLLKPNQEKTEFWEDFSTDADKITEIRAYYIVFTDGTKWELDEDLDSKLKNSENK